MISSQSKHRSVYVMLSIKTKCQNRTAFRNHFSYQISWVSNSL